MRKLQDPEAAGSAMLEAERENDSSCFLEWKHLRGVAQLVAELCDEAGIESQPGDQIGMTC